MNKCKWKDGKFEGCGGFNGHVKLVQDYHGKWKTICKSCHTDIRKPVIKAPSHEEIAIEGLSLATGMSMVKAKQLIEAVISVYSMETP